jgi:proline iminopeptidase
MDRFSQGIHNLPAPGITLTYTVKGTGPYLFIQAAGWGISSRYLQDGLSPLESHFTLIYPEPRGSRPSSRPENEEDMSDADMADDIERLRLHLGLMQIDLLGHSNGGTIALAYAERYPDVVRRLILLTHWLSGYDDTTVWNRFLDERRSDPTYTKAVRLIESPNKPDTQDEWYQYLLGTLSLYVVDVPRHYPIFVEAMGVPSLWVNKAQRAANKKKKVEVYHDLHKVKAKTLCLGSAEDPICSANMSRVTAKGIAGAEVVIIEGCGHFPWIERPEDFFGEVVKFIKR